jgi:23S rRNA (cytidine1920-2'-O)/16S rRNA (cytidine1409-2'-O)-methyltransferase
VHKEVLEHYLEHAREAGFGVLGLTYSPIRGPEGNIEYLMFVQKSEQPGVLDDSVAEQVVAASHSSLDK